MTTEVRESKLAFVDCETTGLDPARHAPWEVAIIRATHRSDGLLVIEDEWCEQIDLPVGTWLDRKALEIGGFDQRRVDACDLLSREEAAIGVHVRTDGRVFVASNPGFDVGFLTRLLRYPDSASAFSTFREPSWHYRPVCVSTLAAGFLAGLNDDRYAPDESASRALTQPPWSSDTIADALGAGVPVGHERHTALGDALMVKRLYANVYGLMTTTVEMVERFGIEFLLDHGSAGVLDDGEGVVDASGDGR